MGVNNIWPERKDSQGDKPRKACHEEYFPSNLPNQWQRGKNLGATFLFKWRKIFIEINFLKTFCNVLIVWLIKQ